MISDDFFKTLKDDPVEQIMEITRVFNAWNVGNKNIPARNTKHKEYVNAYYVLVQYCNEVEMPVASLKFSPDDVQKNITDTINFFGKVRQQCAAILSRKKIGSELDEAKAEADELFGKGFLYKFTDDDLNNIQKHIDELRGLLQKSHSIKKDHKERLLNKLEKLQSELHKSMTTVDRFWGVFGELIIYTKRFGEAGKPIFDVLKGLIQIVINAQSMTAGLPPASSINFLNDINPSD